MDVKELEKEVKTEIEQFKAETDIVIDDPISYEYAGEIILKGKSVLKEIGAKFEPSVKAAYQAHKAIKDLQNDLEKPVKAMIADLQNKANIYLTEQDRIRKAEQERLDAERKKKEDEEKERLKKEADAAAEAGNIEEAAALRMESDTVVFVPEIAVTEVAKTTRIDAGTVTTQTDIEITIMDKVTLLHALADQGRFDLVEIKDAALKRFIKAAGLTDFPGIQINEVKKAAFRAK